MVRADTNGGEDTPDEPCISGSPRVAMNSSYARSLSSESTNQSFCSPVHWSSVIASFRLNSRMALGGKTDKHRRQKQQHSAYRFAWDQHRRIKRVAKTLTSVSDIPLNAGMLVLKIDLETPRICGASMSELKTRRLPPGVKRAKRRSLPVHSSFTSRKRSVARSKVAASFPVM